MRRYGISDLSGVESTVAWLAGASLEEIAAIAVRKGLTPEQLLDDALFLADMLRGVGEVAEDTAKEIAELETVLKGWKSVVKAIGNQMLGYQTGTSNPADAVERLGIARQAITDYMGGADLATFLSGMGAEGQMTAIADLAALWGDYLSVAQEAYQRPSTEYQAIFEEVIGALGGLKDYGELQISEYEVQLQQLGWLEQIAINTGGGAGAGGGGGTGGGGTGGGGTGGGGTGGGGGNQNWWIGKTGYGGMEYTALWHPPEPTGWFWDPRGWFAKDRTRPDVPSYHYGTESAQEGLAMLKAGERVVNDNVGEINFYITGSNAYEIGDEVEARLSKYLRSQPGKSEVRRIVNHKG